ncbi:50S ribosomal protein L6 [Candidatus Phytoplasma palmae]|uniref:50S ribosomal protein L6 n=1 Tax=Candidatus Phytoplasma palmae TaxID=85624 RepID=UPI0039903D01
MSRIGKKAIFVPEGIKVEVKENNLVIVNSSKGKLEYQFNSFLKIKKEGDFIYISRPNDEVFMKKIHGTTRALLFNMIKGLKDNFVKKLEIVGLGYDVKKEGSKLIFNLGFSHNVFLDIPNNLDIEILKNKEIVVKGIDKQFVGEFAAKIVQLRKPEPYKGKGIRYVGQYINRKSGKSAKK